MYENHDKKITDKIFIKVAGLIQRYVKISWLFSLNRLSLLRISHKTLSQSADWFLLWGYVGLPYSIWRVVKRWLKISLQELFVCKYLGPALALLLSNPGKLMNREHRSTARGGHFFLLHSRNFEFGIADLLVFFQNRGRKKMEIDKANGNDDCCLTHLLFCERKLQNKQHG